MKTSSHIKKDPRPERHGSTFAENDITILKECQIEGWYNCEPQKRKRMILEALGNEQMTARQIAYKIGFADLNAVKPRISEMVKEGQIEVVGKALDTLTNVHVSVYRRQKNGKLI